VSVAHEQRDSEDVVALVRLADPLRDLEQVAVLARLEPDDAEQAADDRQLRRAIGQVLTAERVRLLKTKARPFPVEPGPTRTRCGATRRPQLSVANDWSARVFP